MNMVELKDEQLSKITGGNNTNDGHYEIKSYRCNGCGMCQTTCQYNAICMNNGVASISQGLCGKCGDCVSACTNGAIEFVSSFIGEK